MSRILIFLGAINAFLAVGLGALGRHAFKTRITPELWEIYQIGHDYHLAHALGLILAGLLLFHAPRSRLLQAGGSALLAGLLLFCGTLYQLALTGERTLSILTPTGGMLLMLGWILLAIGAIRDLAREERAS